jgi:hypothetical protein
MPANKGEADPALSHCLSQKKACRVTIEMPGLTLRHPEPKKIVAYDQVMPRYFRIGPYQPSRIGDLQMNGNR